MPQFNCYSRDGVTLMVEFKCQRCGASDVSPLKPHVPNDEGSSYLHNLKVPDGWSNHFYGRLLCSECTQKLRAFLNNYKEEETP